MFKMSKQRLMTMIWAWSIIVLLLLLSNVFSEDAESTDGQSNLKVTTEMNVTKDDEQSFFSSMDPKSTPLHLCDSTIHEIEYQPSALIDCNPKNNDATTNNKVGITLYWNDGSDQYIEGFECSGKIWKTNPIIEFFYQTTHTFVQNVIISREECWKLINKNYKNISENRMWETGKRINIKFPTVSYGFSMFSETVIFKIQKLRVLIKSDNTISTIAYTKKPCYYNETMCTTDKGILVWNADNVRTCRLSEGEPVDCFQSSGTNGKRLTCPGLHLLLPDFQIEEFCGVLFGVSNGIFFLPNEIGQIDNRLSQPEQVRNMLTKPRQKREINNREIHAFAAETKSNLNHLLDIAKNGIEEIGKHFQKQICELHRKNLENMAKLGHQGNKIIRFSDKFPPVRGEIVGDLLRVYECIKVSEYRFRERINCTLEYPVEYVYRNKSYYGYMEPITHAIVRDPTSQNLNENGTCNEFYFKTKDGTLLLTNAQAVQANVSTLLQTGVNYVNVTSFPEQPFRPSRNLPMPREVDMTSFHEMEQRNKPIGSNAQNITDSNGFEIEDRNLFSECWSFIKSLFFACFEFLTIYWAVSLIVFGVIIVIVVGCCYCCYKRKLKAVRDLIL